MPKRSARIAQQVPKNPPIPKKVRQNRRVNHQHIYKMALVARLPAITVKYDGTSCPKLFLRKFEHAMKTNEWKKENWLGVLGNSFEHAAEKFYFRWLADQQEYARTVHAAALADGKTAAEAQLEADAILSFNACALALQTAFKSHSDEDSAEQKFLKRKQKLNESIEAYTFDFLALVAAYDDKMPESKRVRRLINNCRPTYLRWMKMHKPKTIEEFLEIGRRVENADNVLLDREEVTTVREIFSPPVLDQSKQLSKEFKKLTTLLINNNNSANNPNIVPVQRPLTCFGCGGNHWRSNCTLNPLKCFKCGGPHFARICMQSSLPQTRNSNFANPPQQQGAPKQTGYPQLPTHHCQIHGDTFHSTEQCKAYWRNPNNTRQGNGQQARDMQPRPNQRQNLNYQQTQMRTQNFNRQQPQMRAQRK
jgi:hypothetical protein